jgi:hypothetical protein
VVASVKSSIAHPIHPPLADIADVAKFVFISFTQVPAFAPGLEKHGASYVWDRFTFLFANFGSLHGQRCVEGWTMDHDEQFLLLHTTVNCDVHRIIKQWLGSVLSPNLLTFLYLRCAYCIFVLMVHNSLVHRLHLACPVIFVASRARPWGLQIA